MVTRIFDITRANQNLGLADRAIRVVIGFAMLGGGAAYVTMGAGVFSPTVLMIMVASLYPLFTAIIGVDLLYLFMGNRSCGNDGRNACGTFPYQVKSWMGTVPVYSESADQHSLEGRHDDPAPLPKHALWRVEQDPMLYPSDADMAEFSAREKLLNL